MLVFVFCVNPFTAKGFSIDKSNQLVLDGVKSISVLRTPTAVKALMGTWFLMFLTLSLPRGSPLTSKIVWR